jgi:hypothetical protein
VNENVKTATLLSVLLAFAASAGELHGVKMPDSVSVEGKTLKLNGMGLRTKAFFKVYVAGLYLESPSSDAKAIVGSDTVRRVDLHMKRDISKDKMTSAITEGFERNSKDQMGALKERLDKVNAAVTDLKEGQLFSITYVPGRGTTVKGSGSGEVTVPGKDFADAMFNVWLGKNPVDEDLKKGMLGAK